MDMNTWFGYVLSLLSLTVLELVLGVDNLVFIAISSSRLPVHKQKIARRLGLLFALVTRLLLLASAYWLTRLDYPLFTLFSFPVSVRDLFLLFGGIFLLYKATQEIHAEFTLIHEKTKRVGKFERVWVIVVQIAILDIVFSLDSVITAVGMTPHFWIMALAIGIAILAMIFASEPLASFISHNPSVRMLAFSFLIMVGMVLVADGMHFHIPRGYIYFAVAFSILVECLNIFRQRRHKAN